MTKVVKICDKHGELKAEQVGSANRCKQCRQEWQKADRKKDNTLYVKASKRRRERIGQKAFNTYEITRRRGIAIEDYEALFIKQDNRCAICEQPETKKNRSGQIARLTLDHHHGTSENRELLCHACNLALGKFKENPALIQEAIVYLNKFKGAK